MKKLYTIVFLTVAAIAANAQPVFNSGDVPVVGDHFKFLKADTTGVLQGAAGNGVTWDFSNLKSLNDSNDVHYIAPSATPYAADFPDANSSEEGGAGSYSYYKTASDGYYYLGSVSPDNQGGAVKYIYTDIAKYYKFPYSFGETFTDNLTAGYTTSGINFSRTGVVTGSYDGFGTLKTPLGTYKDVARIMVQEADNDVATVSGFNVNIKTSVTTYQWRQKGNIRPLLTITFIKVETAQSTTYSKAVMYGPGSVSGTGIAENATGSIATVYPNPAKDRISIVAEGNIQTVTVMNLSGQEVIRTAADGNRTDISIATLPQGIYLVQTTLADGTTNTQKLAVY